MATLSVKLNVHHGGAVPGQVVDLPADVAVRLIAGGYATPGGPPPKSARKADWEAYAESKGVGLDSDMTKDDIIAAVESGG